MKIVTISREFGSGGRELGKRLADALGVPCYDYEIIRKLPRQGDCVIVGRCDLCINTSGKEIKALIPAVAAYVNAWFGMC